MRAHLTLKSSNAKTGPIPVSTTEKASCPTSCPLRGAGCYAESGPLAIHWGKVPERGMEWADFCEAISKLPEGQLWRHNQAGDLPGDGTRIDGQALMLLVAANEGKRGFTYTHYDPEVGDNAFWIAAANAMGFTVNLSADDLAEADRFLGLGIGPVALTVPSSQQARTGTPGGAVVSVCPAAVRSDTSCVDCGICATQHKAVIAFPAHGSSYRRIDIRLAEAA